MARMVPSLTDVELRNLNSRAEARFYEKCRDQLPNDVVVIHSSNWIYRDKKGSLREGEADFTVLIPQSGVFAIEVKGGGVSYDSLSGYWYSIDRDSNKNRIKDPFKQASKERHAILDQLNGHPLWKSWSGNRLTVGHAVFLPDIKNKELIVAPDRPIEIIGVYQDLQNVNLWLDNVVNFWRQNGEDKLGEIGVKLIEKILCNSVFVKPILRAFLDDIESHRLKLTSNQAKVLRTIAGRRRAVISGGAGTGKTILAVEKARQLAENGKKVLFLCYNRPLADFLAKGLEFEKNIIVQSFHQLCDHRIRKAKLEFGRNLLDEAELAYPSDSEKSHFEVHMPYALALSNEILEEKFDALVIDEAQDFSDEYWFAVEELLEHQDSGFLYIFIDENQAMYARHGNLPVNDPPFLLTTNCRNTAPIHSLGYKFYSGEFIDTPDLVGPNINLIARKDDDIQVDEIMKCISYLIDTENISPSQITVLIAKRPKDHCYSLLQNRAKNANFTFCIEKHADREGILVDTVARYKGLESPAVLLWLGYEVLAECQWETIYVGVTRAKSHLTIISNEAVNKFLSIKLSENN